ncbi:Protein of unknown function [Tranquillimonas rosea]|uniref:DUF2927 domain-containing protein n=1 Tax=Tranquillimonas rosea TaxID=641238 RepID=A0A1H9TMM2_9RHOB|nr:DUF2927 domain-containing protein [Tranquillimonas rosea]SER98297.1 Protein of unknown function [Tranquillimonas rosea]
MTRRILLSLLVAGAIAACAPSSAPPVAERRMVFTGDLPPMKVPTVGAPHRPAASNHEIVQDFMELSFTLESGRKLPVFTRFEGPVTIRAVGRAQPSLSGDLDRLVTRFRREAGIDIRRVPASRQASITVQSVSRAELQRAVPQAACFVVPRLSSWEEFVNNRRSPQLDWTTLKTRERMAVFIPRDVSPQEVRDCLHEEVAQALGPLNDLYRLTDSVFNDDNFHTVLTGFDMTILRATYSSELHSGMSPSQVRARLPGILARINPAGNRRPTGRRDLETPRDWVGAIETALGPDTTMGKRRAAAGRAVSLARQNGWNDNRMAFSLFALGRLSLADDPELALSSFLKAGTIYAQSPETRLHQAHVAMQLAAFALSSGQPEAAIDLVDTNSTPVAEAGNAALLASLMLVKVEGLEMLGRPAEAQEVRRESLALARYGFGSDDEVRRRAGEIAGLNPVRKGTPAL